MIPSPPFLGEKTHEEHIDYSGVFPGGSKGDLQKTLTFVGPEDTFISKKWSLIGC